MSSVVQASSTSPAAEPTHTNRNRPRSATVAVPVTLYSPPKDGEFHVVSVSVSVSDSLSSIAKWAAQIAPGSPPAPSPRSSSFYGSFTSRTPHRRASISANFLNLWESPSSRPHTPAPKPVSPRDLLAQGYTSFVVHLPSLDRARESEPESPSPTSKRVHPPLPLSAHHPRERTKSLSHTRSRSPRPAADEEKPKSLTRLRSFSLKGKKAAMHMLSSKSSSVAVAPPVPALPNHMSYSKSSARPPSRSSSSRAENPSSRSSKTKSTPHTRYGALLAPGGGAGALPLAQEVALSQMLDGGSLDANVRRVTARHARDTGDKHAQRSVRDDVYASGGASRRAGSKRGEESKDRRPVERRESEAGKGGGVSGVYRDPRGGLWWDEDESLELAGLLPTDVHPQASLPPAPSPLGASNAHNIHDSGKEKEKRRGLLPRLMTSSKPPPSGPIPAPPAQAHAGWVPLHSPNALAPAQADDIRRGSATSEDSPDSELDTVYAVRLRDSASFAGGFVPGYSVEKHLRRPARGIEAFEVSPLDVVPASYSGAGVENKRERRERKRPAPLTLPLPLPSPPPAHPTSTSTVSAPRTAHAQRTAPPQLATLGLDHPMHPTRAEREGRHEYFASSFAPAPVSISTSNHSPHSSSSTYTQSQAHHTTQSTKASRRGSITAGFSALGSALSATARSARRASASPTSPAYPCAQQVLGGKGGSSAHLPLSLSTSRTASAHGHGATVPAGTGKSLRSRASRSKLAGLFKRG
ncbi:hypothetical protein M0805_000073 [Coniferiporia weirii]|nr:hypothetical protein M0805_000073 [Coniferiporia weirii]